MTKCFPFSLLNFISNESTFVLSLNGNSWGVSRAFVLKNEDQEMFLLYPKKEFLGLQVVPFVYNYYVLKCAHTSAHTINS